MKINIDRRIAYAGLVIAIFGCVGTFLALPQTQDLISSFLTGTRSPETRIKCSGASIGHTDYRWELQGNAICDISLESGEVLIGTATTFGVFQDPDPCTVFAFEGPAEFADLRLSDATLTLHTAIDDAAVVGALLEGSMQDLEGRVVSCSHRQRGITQFRLPYTFSVPGSQEEGIAYTAVLPGRYNIGVVDGAYSSYPEGSGYGVWRTRINVYVNRLVEWGERKREHQDDNTTLVYLEPVNPDGIIGSAEISTQERANIAGVSWPPLTFDLEAREYLVFVPIDDKGWYKNPEPNRGQVILQISLHAP